MTRSVRGELTVLFLSNRREDRGANAPGPDPLLLVNGLTARGFVVRTRALNRFPLNPLAGWGTFYAGFDPARALTTLLFDRDVDVVMSVGESNVAVILFLARLFRFTPPVVLREISARGWARRDRVVDYVVPRVDGILALTPRQCEWAEAQFALRRPADMVGFAIDENFYRPDAADARASCDGGYVLAVGDDSGRDYPCLIEACRGLSTKLVLRTDAVLSIPDDMSGRVTMVGRLSHEALRDLYAAASIVVVPLRQVDHPSGITALFEAMAMAKPVVASDVGSSRAIVEDGVNGLLVPVGDAATLRATLSRLSGDPAARARLGDAARATIEGAFSYDAYVSRFADGLRRAVNNCARLSRGRAPTGPRPWS